MNALTHLAPGAAHSDAVQLSPAAVLTIAVVVTVVLAWKSGPKGRAFAGRAVRRLLRKLWNLVRVTWWASRMGIGVRLAGRLQPGRWDAMVETRTLKGLRRGKVTRTPSGVSVRLVMSGSLTQRDVSGKARQLEAGLGLSHGSARVVAAKRADHAILQILLRDPLKDGVKWAAPAAGVRLADPLPLAMTAFGDTLSISLKNRIGIFGGSGMGKSCVQRLIGARAVQCEDADLEIWDLKFGAESQHYAGKATRVTCAADALDRVDWYLGAEFPRRAARMVQLGTSNWRESAKDPARVLIVDEGNGIIRGFSAKQQARFFQMAEQGRALGVFIVWATQFPKAVNLPTELRSQLNVMVCLKLERASESQLVFEDDAKDGWEPHKLPGVGWMLVRSDGQRTPQEAKAFWLSEDEFRDLPLAGVAPVDADPSGVYAVVADAVPDDAPPPAAVTPVNPSVAQDVWDVLAVAECDLSLSELARRTNRSKGGVHAAVHRMVEEGRAQRTPKGFRLPVAAEPVKEKAEEKEL